ncbi:unnamed protein product [Rotaria sp. Silwood1]|nr:unnamed protein product [Rotaria sp. Silwood1]CAF0746820.1 unnamed protein product [Rotaria sp. Silwood1]CAF3328629.1 unnamed protein product [Rotaria sp. Silwood1]CAF4558594.1 unnamed protein product [Rotaria sp. Silwood1]CAF4850461.1 unnamed protein product [Rotaria sp. Silwood1]
MSSPSYEDSKLNNSLINKIIVPSGSSLIDLLNQQSSQTTTEDDSIPTMLSNKARQRIEQIQNSESNGRENERLSSLFNTTGRERNTTTPLKKWLYEHQDNPYPTESERQELMKKTSMSAYQIQVWFTNARVQMRKAKTQSTEKSEENKNKNQKDNSNNVAATIDLTVSSDDEKNESHIDLSMLLDNTKVKVHINSPIPLNHKRIILAYSCLIGTELVGLRCLVSMYPNQLSISDGITDHTTHLIIGREEKALLCPLTTKLFQAIARHLYILSYKWIRQCLKQNDLIDETDYEMRGDIPFGEYHDGMRKSRLSKDTKLFEKCQFFLLCDGCQDRMSKNELCALIKLCHGSILSTFPLTSASDSSTLTIILCNALLPFESANQQQLFQLCRSNGVHFLSPEWIIESIVQFTLQPFDSYEETF